VVKKQLRRGMTRSILLILIIASMITFGSPVLAKNASGPSDNTPFDATLSEFFDIRLDFSGPPFLNETVELAVTVSPAQDVSNVVIQIVLPEGIELVEGNLGWEGDLSAHQRLQQGVVVKVVKVGSYEIQASVEGLTPDGQLVQQRKWLYVATSEKAAAVSEIPIAIPEEPVISPLPETDIEGQLGEAELVADPEAGLVTLGDGSPEAPKVIREEGVEVEGDGKAGLVADPKVGLVTLGDYSPEAPKVIREEGVEVEGDGEAELVADPKVGLVTIGDDSPNPPKVTKEGDIFAKGSGDAIAGNCGGGHLVHHSAPDSR